MQYLYNEGDLVLPWTTLRADSDQQGYWATIPVKENENVKVLSYKGSAQLSRPSLSSRSLRPSLALRATLLNVLKPLPLRPVLLLRFRSLSSRVSASRSTPVPVSRGKDPPQFVCPGQPVQKRSRPSGANPPAAVRVPRSADAVKGAARQGRTRLRQFVCPGHLVPRQEKHRRIASTVLKICTFTQIAAAYRHPYAPAPAGPVPDDRVR